MQAWSPEEFERQLRQVGEGGYHDKHPFHQLMHEGTLTPEQIRCWVANRFYYQKSIPIKDAILLSRIPVQNIRQHWVQRIVDHDGSDTEPGGIEKWLRLGEGVGLSRTELEQDRHLLPGVRYAVDAYVNFVATRPWVEGVASSLTELFAPQLMKDRLSALKTKYDWIDPEAFAYFRARPPLATRDSQHGMSVVLSYCQDLPSQQNAVAALRFKCDVLWAQLDAIYLHSVVTPLGHGQQAGRDK